jgi:hypothetical protein
MEVLLGGLAGLATGLLGSIFAALVQTLARWLRNARRARRGDAAIREPLFTPYWVLFGILGLIAGMSWTWRLSGTWVTGAYAGLGVPAFATLIFVGWALAQLRR